MPWKSENELDEIKQRLYTIVWPLVSDFDNKNWKLKSGKDKETTGLVFKGKHDAIGTIWKMEVILDISIEKFTDAFFKNHDYDWMPSLSEFRQLEVHDDGDEWSWHIEYTHSRGRGTFKDRDFLSINFHQRLKSGWTFDMTVDANSHPDDPKTPGCVRGEQLPSGSIVRPLPNDPKRVELVWMHNMDMKGMLPRNLINLIMSTYLNEMAQAFIEKCKRMSSAAS